MYIYMYMFLMAGRAVKPPPLPRVLADVHASGGGDADDGVFTPERDHQRFVYMYMYRAIDPLTRPD